MDQRIELIGGSANYNDDVFSGNIMSAGLLHAESAALVFNNTNFSDNLPGSSACLILASCDTVFNGGTMVGNSALDNGYNGGAVLINGGTLKISSTVFSANMVSGYKIFNVDYTLGGAVCANNISSAQIESAKFIGNRSCSHGGAVRFGGVFNTIVIRGTEFSGNATNGGNYGNGGALSIQFWNPPAAAQAAINIESCIFKANSYSEPATSSVFGGYGGGAAMIATGGGNGGINLTIDHSEFSDNTAETQNQHCYSFMGGGALILWMNSHDKTVENRMTISNTTFSDNVAGDGLSTIGVNGGAMICRLSTDGGIIDLNNCVFAGNRAVVAVSSGYGSAQGGAVKLENYSGTMTMTDCVFTGNAAERSNPPPDAPSPYFNLCGGAIYAEGDFTYAVTSGRNIVNTGNLADYGGFLFLKGGRATFNVANGGTLTIGNPADAASSSSTAAPTAATDSVAGSGTIEITGGGLMTINSNVSKFTGNWIVNGGSLKIADNTGLAGNLIVNLVRPSETQTAVAGLSSLDNINFTVSAETLGYSCGTFRLLSGITPAAIKLLYDGAEHLLVPGTSLTAGAITFDCATLDGVTIVTTTGKFERLTGTVINGNAALNVSHCRVKSMISAATTDISGNAVSTISLQETPSPCNIYGGGNNIDVDGSIKLTIADGGYSGIIYGGSRAYDTTVSVHDIQVDISGAVHIDNQKLIAAGKGCSAWTVGGGTAAAGGSITAGSITISAHDSKLSRLVGGAQAQGAGSTAAVQTTELIISGAITVSGNVYGGGYAYDGGISTVLGDTMIRISDASILGNIYGGAAAPGHTGNAIVNGGSTVSFSGSGDELTIGTVSGDGAVPGSVKGIKTLEFTGFSGEFSANLKAFDRVELKDNSEVAYSGGYRFQSVKTTFGSFADGIRFAEGDKLLTIELGTAQTGFELMTTTDDDTFDDLKIEIFRDNVFLCSFSYGETVDGFSVSAENGYLSLSM